VRLKLLLFVVVNRQADSCESGRQAVTASRILKGSD
jgi:hypothetical protein